jgi:hypothetical protein
VTQATPSAADIQAIDHVKAAGYSITASQLRRWRPVGLTPIAPRVWPGRGSSSLYTPDQLDWITAAAALAPNRDPLCQRVLWLFVLGYPIVELHLKQAHLDLFVSIGNFLTDEAGSPVPEDHADAVADAVMSGRARGAAVSALRRNARRAGRRLLAEGFTDEHHVEPDDLDDDEDVPDPTLPDFVRLTVANLVTLTTVGTPYTDEGPEAVLASARDTFGLPADYDGIPGDPDTFAQRMADLSVSQLAAAISTVNYQHMVGNAADIRVECFGSDAPVRDWTQPPQLGLALLPLLLTFID